MESTLRQLQLYFYDDHDKMFFSVISFVHMYKWTNIPSSRSMWPKDHPQAANLTTAHKTELMRDESGIHCNVLMDITV